MMCSSEPSNAFLQYIQCSLDITLLKLWDKKGSGETLPKGETLLKHF